MRVIDKESSIVPKEGVDEAHAPADPPLVKGPPPALVDPSTVDSPPDPTLTNVIQSGVGQGISSSALGLSALSGTGVQPSTTVDAIVAHCQELLDHGHDVVWVNDIDNTLADTRYKTLAAVEAFLAKPDLQIPDSARSRLESLEPDDVALDGRATFTALFGAGVLTDRFAAFWKEFFWDADNMIHDQPIACALELNQRLASIGVKVMYLTARWTDYEDASRQWLSDNGFPFADDEHADYLMLKPEGQRTGPYKLDRMQTLAERGFTLGGFLTESREDIRHLRKGLDDLHAVQLEFPLDTSTLELDDGTPLLRR